MKKIMVVLLVAGLLAFPSAARSQASFLFGMAAGAMLFNGGPQVGSGGAMILYTAPEDLLARVKTPLGVRLISFTIDPQVYKVERGLSFHQVFQKALPEGETLGHYEVLQVVRVFYGERPGRAAIWFAYIEKEHIASPVAPVKDNKSKK